MAMEKAVGIATVYVNGKTYRTKPGAKFNAGGFKRTALVGDGQINSYSEEPVPATVSGEFTCTSSVDIQEINDIVNGTIIFAADTGQKWTIRDAFCSQPTELTAGAGALNFAFEGPPAVQTSP